MAEIDHTGKIVDNKYELTQKLGAGGMGEVYLARHQIMGNEVAIKFLKQSLTEDETLIQRFIQEARAAATIKHRNIIDVYDVGTADWGQPYMVMEYLVGEELHDLLANNQSIGVEKAIETLLPAMDGLFAIHEKGIIHRDLKPENIFLQEVADAQPEVKLFDFGISKSLMQSADKTLTQTGHVVGTPAYMAPEQAKGQKNMDHRVDIYAMGVILYRALTGRIPFDGDNYGEIMAALLTTDPVPPETHNPNIPASVSRVILRALDKNPDNRQQSAKELKEALREAWTEASIPPAPVNDNPIGDSSDLPSVSPEADDPIPLTSPKIRPSAPRMARHTFIYKVAAGIVFAVGLTTFLILFAGKSPRSVDEQPSPGITDVPAKTAAINAPVRSHSDAANKTSAPVERNADAPVKQRAETDTDDNPSHKSVRADNEHQTATTDASHDSVSVSDTISSTPQNRPTRPVDVDSLLSQASRLYLEGEMNAALRTYRKATQAAPGNAKAWRGRGLAAIKTGANADAKKSLSRYLKLNPNAPDIGQINRKLDALKK